MDGPPNSQTAGLDDDRRARLDRTRGAVPRRGRDRIGVRDAVRGGPARAGHADGCGAARYAANLPSSRAWLRNPPSKQRRSNFSLGE